MEKLCELPQEVRLKILYYAHPKMDDGLKLAIRVTASHQRISYISREWESYLRVGSTFSTQLSWFDVLSTHTSSEERKELIANLEECGCCARHCSRVVGCHTFKKLNTQYTSADKLCKCSCRHHIRMMRMLDILNPT